MMRLSSALLYHPHFSDTIFTQHGNGTHRARNHSIPTAQLIGSLSLDCFYRLEPNVVLLGLSNVSPYYRGVVEVDSMSLSDQVSVYFGKTHGSQLDMNV